MKNIVLIVNDKKNEQKALADFSHKEGFSVSIADNAFQALSMIEKSKYDLLLVRNTMNEMGGKEFLALVRDTQKKPPPCIALYSEGEIKGTFYDAVFYLNEDTKILLGHMKKLIKKKSS